MEFRGPAAHPNRRQKPIVFLLLCAARDVAHYGFGELGGSGVAADVAGDMYALCVHAGDGAFETLGGIAFADVSQHQHGGLHQRCRIGQALAGDIGRGAVDGLKDSVVIAHIGAGHDAEAADEAGSEIGDNVAITFIYHRLEQTGHCTTIKQAKEMVEQQEPIV